MSLFYGDLRRAIRMLEDVSSIEKGYIREVYFLFFGLFEALSIDKNHFS